MQNIHAPDTYEQAHNYLLLELTMALKMKIYILENKITYEFVQWYFGYLYPQDL